jgi:hypothetical protein
LQNFGAEAYCTDIFYANGASFNKGAALSEAIAANGLRSAPDAWLLSFDADIMPPREWRRTLEDYELSTDNLYGALRYDRYPAPAIVPGKPGTQLRDIFGYFQLFNNSDPVLPPATEPLYEMCWPSANGYDMAFSQRWHPQQRVHLAGLPMTHMGPEGLGWTGRYHPERMEAQRKIWAATGDWRSTRMPNPPALAITT